MPSRPWNESSPYYSGNWLVTTQELRVGLHLAYFLALPEAQGGTDWFVGEISRLSNPHWADVNFADGKLWCAVKPSECGARWLPVVRGVGPGYQVV